MFKKESNVSRRFQEITHPYSNTPPEVERVSLPLKAMVGLEDDPPFLLG